MELRLTSTETKRETEKAYQVEVEIDTPTGLRGWNIWLPKSRTRQEDGAFILPEWLFKAKEKDISEWFADHGRDGQFYGINAVAI